MCNDYLTIPWFLRRNPEEARDEMYTELQEKITDEAYFCVDVQRMFYGEGWLVEHEDKWWYIDHEGELYYPLPSFVKSVGDAEEFFKAADQWYQDGHEAGRCAAKSAMNKLRKIRQSMRRLFDRLVMRRPIVVCFCPRCKHDGGFKVAVHNSGSGPDEWGTCHWFYGYGSCEECGHEGEYGDSSH